MTATLDLHPDTTHPVVDGISRVHAVVDGMDASVPLHSGEFAMVVREVERAMRRLEAVKLQLVAAARTARVAARTGMTGTDAWLARTTRVTGRDAAQAVSLADALHQRLPATQRALAQGVVSREHAAVIDQVTKQLPGDLTAAQRAAVERSLVDKAADMDPAALRRAGRRALAVVEADETVVDAHENDVLGREENRAWERSRLTMRDNGDGTSTGHFTIPTLAGSILQRILHTLASPRRTKLGAGASQTGAPGLGREGAGGAGGAGSTGRAGSTGGAGWDQRLGQAFVEILEHLPTDRLHGKTAATVVVTLDHDQLVAKLKAAGLDTGDLISAREARRLACSAGLLPAVLGRASQLLDLGRSNRYFTESQRTALALRHSTCAADGCERPFAWTELHHRQPWTSGGTTNLDNAIPLCGFHHRRIHDPDYAHRERPGPAGTPVITLQQIGSTAPRSSVAVRGAP